MDNNSQNLMVLIATENHTGLGKPWEAWVTQWKADLILSPDNTPAEGSLEALAVSFYRVTRTGEQSKWYIKAGPVTYAELEEWHATGFLFGKPFPADIQPPPTSGAL